MVRVVRLNMKWSYIRYLRLRLDCSLDPYYWLVSLRKRRHEEKKARHHRKIGRPRIWTRRLRSTLGESTGNIFCDMTNIVAVTN